MHPDRGVLVRKGGGLGDVLGIVPMLFILKNRFPGVPLTLTAPRRWLPVLRSGPAWQLIPEEFLALWRLNASRDQQKDVIEKLKAYSRVYWFSFPKGDWCKTLSKHLGDRLRCLSPVPPTDGCREPHYEFYWHILDPPVTKKEKQALPEVLLDCRSLCRPLPPGKKRLLCHPGSGSKDKRWPLERFMAVFHSLMSSMDLEIHLLIGPAERDLEKIVPLKGDMVLHVDIPLERVAFLMAHTHAFLGNDSGISHLASLCGIRGCVLFGPSNPLVWKPWGDVLKVMPFEVAPDDVARYLAHILNTCS